MKHLLNNATEGLEKPWITLDSDGIHYSSNVKESTLTIWYYDDGTFWSKEVVGELDATTGHRSDGIHGMSNITKVEIGTKITSIGNSAFMSCTNLISIDIPNSVTSIEEDAFCDCSGLTNVTIPNSVTSIGIRAFNTCTSLTSIEIPNSVTKIDGDAFFSCTSLASVTYNGVTYTSKSVLTTALTSNNVTVGSNVFNFTKLSA